MTGGGEDTGDTSSDSNEAETTETATEENTEESTEEETEEATEESTEEVVEEEEADEVVGVGEALTVDGIDFTVNEWYQAESVGSDFMAEEANDTYIVMDVSVVNNGNEAITVDSSYFKIVDGERTYEPDSMASSAANEDDLGLFLEEINPGSSRNAFVVFDVTQEVVDSSEKQVQVQSGFWGTETGLINLQ
nr:DUF4352 domain-containing protein [Salinicoccus roseus]